MFKLFKKKERRYGFKSHPRISNFSRGLTVEEKAAMAHSFFMLMKADDASLNLKMYTYVHEQFESIGFGVKSKYMEQYKANALNDTFSKISELTIDQKKWFAIALHAMLYEIGIKPSFRHIQYYLTLGQQTSNPYIK